MLICYNKNAIKTNQITLINNADGAQGKMIIDKRTNLNDYKIIKTIGRGAFGRVQLVRRIDSHDFLFSSFGLLSNSRACSQRCGSRRPIRCMR